MKLKQILAIAATLAFASAAHAQSAGSIVLGAGWMHLAPQSSSDPLEINSFDGAPINQPVPDSGASVKGTDTLGLSLNYFITDHIATELVAGIPPKLELDGSGSLSGLGKLGSVKQFSPALLLKYYFNQANAKVRPYLGIGVSRVWFENGTITNSNLSTELLQGTPGGTTSVSSIQNKWAPVFNGGITYAFSKHWSVGLSVSYLPLSTTARFNTTLPGTGVTVASSAHITINPIVSYLSVNYTF